MWSWISKNRILAVVFALLLMSVLASAVGGYHYRSRAMELEQSLKKANDSKRAELLRERRAWKKREKESSDKIQAAIRARIDLERRLREIRDRHREPFVEPASPTEIVNRFNELGYKISLPGPDLCRKICWK
jgi:hypothetical protein